MTETEVAIIIALASIAFTVYSIIDNRRMVKHLQKQRKEQAAHGPR